MKNKTTLAAFIIAILLSSSAAYAAGDRTISLGYAQGDVRLGDGNRKDIRLDDDLKGINVKYLHKLSEMFGAIGSFTYTDLNYDYLNNNVKIGDASFDYYSLMVGPSVHFNEFFSMYALLGIGHGKAKASVLGYGKKEEQDSLAYGVGMQFNPLNNIAIDASYEYAKLKNANIGTWVLGIGYRF